MTVFFQISFASTTFYTTIPCFMLQHSAQEEGVHSLYSDVTIEELYKNKTEVLSDSRKLILQNVDIKQEKSADRLQTTLTFQRDKGYRKKKSTS